MGKTYLGTGLERVADVRLATAIASQHLAATVGAIRTSGYATSGKGAGTYVSDALATAALAAAHPRFCKQSLDGRYWRLLPDPCILVTQGGAEGDGATDDYAAIQAAIDYGLSFGGATIHFPPATYWVGATPLIASAKGLNLTGEGPDRSIISAGAMPAMKTLGYWRSRVEGLAFWCNSNTSGGAFELEGRTDGSFGVQGITFANCMFFGNYNSKYAFTNQRIAGGFGQGSECVWIGCAFQGVRTNAGDALFLNNGSNALQNTILGCNFQSFNTGVLITAGNVDILHCGFQSVAGYGQIANGGFDVDCSNASVGDTVTMTGCRTESLCIYKGGGNPAHVSNWGHVPATAGNWTTGAKLANDLVRGTTAAGNIKLYRVTTAGTSGATQPVWPESGTVGDGSVTWTQTDFNVFDNFVGRMVRGEVQLGQILPNQALDFPVRIEDVVCSRDDIFAATTFGGDAGAPLCSNVRVNVGDLTRPIKMGFNGGSGARNANARNVNLGAHALVWTEARSGGVTYDIAIQRGSADVNAKVKNWFDVIGGWGFHRVDFADLAAISREGVVYYVTDGAPGSSPLTGGGAGCLAIYQNGAWRAIAMGSGTGGIADGDKGDITVTASGTTWTIDSDAVTNAKLANVASATIKGRATAGTGDPEDLTGTQATALLDTFTSGAKGLTPASGGGTTNFLRADGAWAAPPGGGGSGSGDVVGPASATDNAIARFDGATGKLVQSSPSTMDDNGTLLPAYNTAAPSGVGFGNWYGSGALFGAGGAIVATFSATTLNLASNAILQWNLDSGLSRSAAGVLHFGNGAAGDYSATLVADKILLGTTTAGTEKMHVAGRIRSSTGGFEFPDGSIQTTAATGGGGGVSDGDKGDITVSSSGTVWTIDNGAVSLAKMADVATGTLFYRKTAGTGAPEVQTLATLKTDLGLTGTNSGDQTITLTGDVTGSGTGSFAATIASDAVTNAKLANVASATIKGRTTAGSGDPEDLTGTQATALLDTFTSAAKGLAPASGGGTTNFLRADGTWAAPSGGGGGGAPGGNSGEVQFNNGGTFDGAASVEIDGGNLKLVSTSDPAAPTGGILLYSSSFAGRHLPKIIGPSGINTALQVGLHGNSVLMIGPSSSTAAPTIWGGTLTTIGTLSSQQTIASANPWQATQRKRAQTAATAGTTGGFRVAYTQWFRGNAAGFGGFFFRAQFGQNLNVNGAQCFVGLCASTAALASTAGAVGALINMIGMGYDTTDASTGNWFLYRNDGSGTATKVDLGATNAARNTTHGYDLIIFCPPGAATEIFVRIVNLHTGATVLDTSYTTDIPAVNTGLAWKAEVNNGAVASAVNIEIAKVYVESDY